MLNAKPDGGLLLPASSINQLKTQGCAGSVDSSGAVTRGVVRELREILPIAPGKTSPA